MVATKRSMKVIGEGYYEKRIEVTTAYKTAVYTVDYSALSRIKWNEEGTETVYTVSGNFQCDCPAGQHNKPCKHADATRKLIQLRIFK